MAGKTLALVELMRPKNMILAAITVPLGAHFGINGDWSANDGMAVAVQIFTVLTFMGAGNAMNDIKDAAIDLVAHPASRSPLNASQKLKPSDLLAYCGFSVWEVCSLEPSSSIRMVMHGGL